MKKTTIAKIRKIVQNPVKFIEDRIDACTLFLLRYLTWGTWFSGAVMAGALTSVILPSDPDPAPKAPTRVDATFVEKHVDTKRSRSSPAIGVKEAATTPNLDKGSIRWAGVSDRIRRFPLTAIVSVRPADAGPKVKVALSLKRVDQVVYRPVFSDHFVDASNKPVVSYGIYVDTYSATKPIWAPWVTPENRRAAYQRLASFLWSMKNYFSSPPALDADIEDTAVRTLDLMRNDRPGLVRTQSHFPIGRSASFHALSPQRDAPLTSDPVPRASDAIQGQVSRLVKSVQASFVFRVDILQALILKIEQ